MLFAGNNRKIKEKQLNLKGETDEAVNKILATIFLHHQSGL